MVYGLNLLVRLVLPGEEIGEDCEASGPRGKLRKYSI